MFSGLRSTARSQRVKGRRDGIEHVRELFRRMLYVACHVPCIYGETTWLPPAGTERAGFTEYSLVVGRLIWGQKFRGSIPRTPSNLVVIYQKLVRSIV